MFKKYRLKNSFIILISIISLHVAALSQLAPLDTQTATKKVLTVAALKIDYIPYFAINEKNEIGGIYPEYIKHLAKTLDMQVHYKIYNSVPELEDAMKQGRADISLGLQLTKKRQDYITMSEPILVVPRTLLITKKLAAQPFYLLNNNKIKLALFKFDVDKSYISQLLPNTYQFTLSKYSDIAPALNYKLANAHLSDSLTNQHLALQLNDQEFTTLTLNNLPDKKWHLPLVKQNTALNKLLNKHILKTEAITMLAIVARSSQWQQYNKKSQMIINDQQQDWLNQHAILRYTTLPQWDAITIYNEPDKPSGLSISVLNRIATILGVNLEYIPSRSIGHALELIESGRVDIIPAVLQTKKHIGVMGFSRPYLTSPWSMIVLKDSTLDINKLRQGKHTITSPNGPYAQSIMDDYFSNSELIASSNMKHSLALLKKNKVDAVFTTLAATKSWLKQDKNNNNIYKLLPNLLINNNVDVQLGVSKYSSPLKDLVNQALAVTGHEELEALSRTWIELDTEQERDIKMIVIYGLLAGVAFTLVMLGFFLWNQKLRQEIAFRRIAQQRALAAEQKLSSIANAIPGAVVQFSMLDNQLFFTYASEGIEDFTPFQQVNLSESQAINTNLNSFFSFISPSKANELIKATKYALQDKQGLDFECRLNSPYNNWLNLVAFPSSYDGNCIWNGVLLEINQRKEQEHALSVEKSKADSAVKAKSYFLAMMSHEIRTPLSGVISTTELLAQSQLDFQQRIDINTIISSANNLLQILNDVLDHTKMETHQFSVEKIEYDLLVIVEDAIRAHIASAHAKNLHINFYFGPLINRFVKTDPTRLQQILSNLISNAVKFTQCGIIDILVELVSTENKIQLIEFKVIDSGLGIALENHRSLFDPFTQAESSTNRKYGGSGLGLSICRMLVERLNGQINLSSQLGQGSEFNFTIPLESYQDNKPPVAVRHILILNDDSENIKRVSDYLSHWQIDFTLESSTDVQVDWLNANKSNNVMVIFNNIVDVITLKSVFKHYVWLKLCKDESEEYGADYYLSTNPFLVSSLLDILANKDTQNLTSHRTNPKQKIIKLQTKEEAINSCRLILVAEDHPTNRKVLKRQLENLGYYADYVENGVQALKAITEQYYNLLITDCHMPELDGYELTRVLRQRGCSIPIIAYTANALIGEAQRCIELGMNSYITKPVSLSLLQIKLNEYLPKSIQDTDNTKTTPVNKLQFKLNELQAMFGSKEIVQELLTEFIVSCKVDLEELNNANLANSFKELANIAHRLKGAAQIVLAYSLSDIASELEQAANQQNSPLCVSNLQALTQSITDYENCLLNLNN